jgi:2-(1,2-epoxy-1,2-dihydrophenyl)acetyl-CoA isomerase
MGESLSAADAERFGLVARVVSAESLLDEAQAIAARLAAGAPRAIALTKRALDSSWDATLEESLEYEAYLQGIAGATDDHREGIAAFVEKRPPRFSGR